MAESPVTDCARLDAACHVTIVCDDRPASLRNETLEPATAANRSEYRRHMAASTVAQDLAALPVDCRVARSAVRQAINHNLPKGNGEGMQFCGFFYRASPPTC
jgi:hypothetical protein